jgi:hypothetical protein
MTGTSNQLLLVKLQRVQEEPHFPKWEFAVRSEEKAQLLFGH